MCIIVCAMVSIQPIMFFVNMICNLAVSEGFIYDTVVCYLALFVLMFLGLKRIYRKIKPDIMGFIAILVGAWLITMLMFPDNGKYMYTKLTDVMNNPLYYVFLYSFPGYMFVRYISDYEQLKRIMSYFSVAVVVCSIVSFFIVLKNQETQQQYMVFAYNMLLHTTFLILMFFEKKNPIYLVIGIAGAVMIVLAGCRGAVVCLALSIVVYTMFRKTNSWKKLFFISLIATGIVLLVIYFENIISYMTNLAEKLDISSRTLDLLESGDIADDSGRGAIQEKIIENFNLVGHGLFGDRVLSESETYAHNFAIEIICHFGYLYGIPILITVFVLLLRGLFAKNASLRFLIIVFMSAGIFKLFLSGSYLNLEPSFYVLLGLCVNSIKGKSNNKQMLRGR